MPYQFEPTKAKINVYSENSESDVDDEQVTFMETWSHDVVLLCQMYLNA